MAEPMDVQIDASIPSSSLSEPSSSIAPPPSLSTVGVRAQLDGAVLISQGAEGRVFEYTFLGRPCIVKERFSKKYRHPVLDRKITKTRLHQEARTMFRCKKLGVDTPCLYFVEPDRCRLFMERIEGCTVKHQLLNPLTSEEESLSIAREMGRVVATMHNADVIHGDLTTSNFMLRTQSSPTSPLQLVVIDFGLSSVSTMAEDAAVDLYVMERAFLSTHPNSQALVEALLESYAANCKKAKTIMPKFAEGEEDSRCPSAALILKFFSSFSIFISVLSVDTVRMRGRKRTMLG